MAETVRSAAATITRTRSDGQNADGSNDIFAEGNSVKGRFTNLIIPEIEIIIEEVMGQIGPVNWWNRRVRLRDGSFESFEVDQEPVALGPGIYEFETLWRTTKVIGTGDTARQQRKKAVFLAYIQPGQNPLDMENPGAYNQPITLKPTRLLKGGPDANGHLDQVGVPSHGSTGNTFASAYLDLAGVNNDVVYVTKLPGLAAVQHLPIR